MFFWAFIFKANKKPKTIIISPIADHFCEGGTGFEIWPQPAAEKLKSLCRPGVYSMDSESIITGFSGVEVDTESFTLTKRFPES